jgi:hypothetical protein
MRKEKALITLLRGIVDLLAEESARQPQFAARLESLLSTLPERRGPAQKPAKRQSSARLPDIYGEWTARGEADFRLWLCDQPVAVLRAVIRAQDLDPTHRAAKWKETEKLAGFIADSLRARLSRGSAFIGRGANE